MKCPYKLSRIEQVNQNHYEYNEDNLTTFHEQKLVEERLFADCLKYECAVWVDGSCRYNGSGVEE